MLFRSKSPCRGDPPPTHTHENKVGRLADGVVDRGVFKHNQAGSCANAGGAMLMLAGEQPLERGRDGERARESARARERERERDRERERESQRERGGQIPVEWRDLFPCHS